MPKQFNACQTILRTARGMITGKTKQNNNKKKERKKEKKKKKHTTLYSIKALNKMTFS